MANTPPTAADIDTWASNGSYGSGTSVVVNLLGAEVDWINGGHSDTPFTFFALGYTQNDSTQQIIQLPGDPTSDQNTAWICWALYNAYGAVLVREYILDFSNTIAVNTTQTMNVVANGTEQTRVNNTSNWVQFS